MARAPRLASRIETLSASIVRLRQNLTFAFYRSPWGAACGAGPMNRPCLIIRPICARAIRCAAKAGWPAIIPARRRIARARSFAV